MTEVKVDNRTTVLSDKFELNLQKCQNFYEGKMMLPIRGLTMSICHAYFHSGLEVCLVI